MTGATVFIFGLVFLVGSINANWIPKIVGGENAKIKHFPYLVSIRYSGGHFCGGSIISDRHILTAAHCVEGLIPYAIDNFVTIHSGTSRTDEEGTVRKIQAVNTHPKRDRYDDGRYYDISILTLDKPIIFDKYQRKIDLPSHDIEPLKVATTAGWGRIEWNGKSPKQLQKLKVVLLPSDKCQKFVEKKLRQDQVCTFRSVGTGPCHGDSGGPLVSNNEVVGIVSYVQDGHCAADIPTVYTNVYAYRDFIEPIINQ